MDGYTLSDRLLCEGCAEIQERLVKNISYSSSSYTVINPAYFKGIHWHEYGMLLSRLWHGLGPGAPHRCGRFPHVVPIEIHVNGTPRSVPDGITVSELISELGYADRRVAVECNRTVVPRAEHATTKLAAGDRVEVVTFVGGGV